MKVQIILEKSKNTAQYFSATFLNNAGIVPFIDSKHAIFHKKFMVIDGARICRRQERRNLLIITDAQLANSYLSNWREHKLHCDEYGKAK